MCDTMDFNDFGDIGGEDLNVGGDVGADLNLDFDGALGGEDAGFNLGSDIDADLDSDFVGDLGGGDFANNGANDAVSTDDNYGYDYDYEPDPTEGIAENPFQSDSTTEPNDFTDDYIDQQHNLTNQLENNDDTE